MRGHLISMMNIVTALNKKYIPYTVTMLASLCKNNDRHIDAYLLNCELNDDDMHIMEQALAIYDISLISICVDKKRIDEKLPRNEQWTIEIYFRLMMLELIPDHTDRLLYLDGDIIINHDIVEYYHTDFCGADMVVCDDKGGLNLPDSYGPQNREMLSEAYSKGHRYFNSGVLLINAKKLRQKYNFDYYIKIIKKWKYEMEAPDQDILNYVHWKNVKYVDFQKYNLFARVAHNQRISMKDVELNTAIIHYAGFKPWEAGNFHYDIEKIWWKYAKDTPFYEELLVKLVLSVVSDRSVEEYISQVERELFSKKKLLERSLNIIEKATNDNNSEYTNNSKSSEMSSYLHSGKWNYGYLYSNQDVLFWKDIKKKDNYLELLEKFLEKILDDSSAEDYVLELLNEIEQIDKALDVANELMNKLSNSI